MTSWSIDDGFVKTILFFFFEKKFQFLSLSLNDERAIGTGKKVTGCNIDELRVGND